jgi:hypothetical protein
MTTAVASNPISSVTPKPTATSPAITAKATATTPVAPAIPKEAAPHPVPAIKATKKANGPVRPDVLQDILYEILANGLDPREAKVTSAQIEQFLFEHARSPKNPEAFLEFFQKHELSTNIDDHLKPVELKALPAVPAAPNTPATLSGDRGGPSNDNGPGCDDTRPNIDVMALARAARPDSETSPVVVPAKGQMTSRTVWAAAAGITILLGIGAGLGFAVANLKAEVDQAKTAQHQSEQAVMQLEQRISGLQSEVARNGESVQRLEPQLDLLIETIAPGQTAQSVEPIK